MAAPACGCPAYGWLLAFLHMPSFLLTMSHLHSSLCSCPPLPSLPSLPSLPLPAPPCPSLPLPAPPCPPACPLDRLRSCVRPPARRWPPARACASPTTCATATTRSAGASPAARPWRAWPRASRPGGGGGWGCGVGRGGLCVLGGFCEGQPSPPSAWVRCCLWANSAP